MDDQYYMPDVSDAYAYDVPLQINQSAAPETLSGYQDLIRRHDNKLNRDLPNLRRYRNLFLGNVPLKYMAPAVRAQFGDRIDQLVVNLPRYAVTTIENRLNIDGIRLDPTADSDDAQQQAWSDMDMPMVSQMTHLEAFSQSKSFVSVGTDEDGLPRAAAESPLQVTCFQHPLTLGTTSAVKRWKQADGRTAMRTIYLPNENVTMVRYRGQWVLYSDDTVDAVDRHNIGRVLMVPFANQPMVLAPEGVGPEFIDIIPIFEAVNKIATDMMVGAEIHALPRRYALEVAQSDFEDENGNPISPLEQIIGAVWAIPRGEGVNAPTPTVGQFPASDLRNFHDTIKLLLQMGSTLLGLPPHYLALGGDNPASADAIRSSEAQLVVRAERKQTSFGSSWRKVWQLVMAIGNGGVIPDDAKHLQVVWRDAATPTLGLKADAAVKLKESGIITAEIAQEMIGLNASQRDRIAASFAKESSLRNSSMLTAIQDFQSPPQQLTGV